MGLALWIAASRVRDNQHFPADATGGALIGFAAAMYSHGLWFFKQCAGGFCPLSQPNNGVVAILLFETVPRHLWAFLRHDFTQHHTRL